MSLKVEMYKSIRSQANCVSGGYINLDNQQLVCMLTIGTEKKSSLARLVGISEDLFQGRNVVEIENIFKQARGLSNNKQHLFKEIVTINNDLIHVFIRGKVNTNHIITFLYTATDNIGLVLYNARSEVAKLEEEFKKDDE